MIRRTAIATVTIVAALMSIAAGRSVAIRAEVHTISDRGETVQVEVVVQAAPEDMELLGVSPWLSLELRQHDRTVVRWAGQVTLDAQGATRLKMTAKPGEYQLEVSLTALKGRDRGLWSSPVVLGTPNEAPNPPTPLPAPPDQAEPPAPEISRDVPTAAAATAGATVAAESTKKPAATAEAVASAAEHSTNIPTPRPTGSPTPRPTATPTPLPTATPTPVPPPPAAPAWTTTEPGTRDITVQLAVPARGLAGRRDLVNVKIGGSPARTVALAGAEAPLHLAMVIQAPPERRQVIADLLAPRAMELLGTGGGQVAVIDGPSFTWLDRGRELQSAIGDGAVTTQDLPERVTIALRALADQPGRRALLVHTEGGPEGDRAAWKTVQEEAERSGSLIMVSVLRTDLFVDRDRRQLLKLSSASGGRMELVETPALVNKVLEILTENLGATAVIRVAAAGSQGKLTVDSVPPASVVAHPDRVR